MISRNLHYCIVGFGVTGRSCLDFLIKQKITKITITDNQDNLAIQEAISNKTNKYLDSGLDINYYLGKLFIPDNIDIIVLSPGIDRNLPIIKAAVQHGAKLTNDVNLFLEQVNLDKNNRQIKIATVTGTNGKTTVVNILAAMAKQAGINYALCGNVGSPILDYALDKTIELYIIELSSFQLELVENLSSDVACVLNITADHLDRYNDFDEYLAVKLKIYRGAKNIVYCRDDINIINQLQHINIANKISFGVKQPLNISQDFGVDINYQYITQDKQPIIAIKDLSIRGTHNILNVLASLAIGAVLKFSNQDMVVALKNFQGLEHRWQIIGNFPDKVMWVNDSKGTNIGATMAAIEAAIPNNHIQNKLIIILGGVNKNMDFTLLRPLITKYCKAAILIGECRLQLLEIFGNQLGCYLAEDLAMVVKIAKKIAVSGDIVLFSPGCASFDMFDNYQHRGKVFTQQVLDLY